MFDTWQDFLWGLAGFGRESGGGQTMQAMELFGKM